MNYKQAISYLYSLNILGGELGLEREQLLLERLGNPQKKFKVILIGGTSGKGSTTAMISSILQAANYKVGRFIKPHLSRFAERICVNGKEISEADLARIATKVRREAERMKGPKPTFFEIVVAIALSYFAEKKVDFAVLEVGLGGRLDATNVCDALVSVITNVSLEHKRILGNTIDDIAYEKGGIIKERGVLVTAADGKALSIFRRLCKQRSAKIFSLAKDIKFIRAGGSLNGQVFSLSVLGKKYPKLFLPLLGEHQLENAACAISAIAMLEFYGIQVGENAVRKGLESVRWPGRMEIVKRNPLVMLDCAKDVNAMQRLSKEVIKIKPQKIILVISISNDKEYQHMLEAIAPISNVLIATEHKVNKRALKAGKLAKIARKIGVKNVLVIPEVKAALKKAMALAESDDIILITGSVFLVGEARDILLGQKGSERKLNEAMRMSKIL